MFNRLTVAVSDSSGKIHPFIWEWTRARNDQCTDHKSPYPFLHGLTHSAIARERQFQVKPD